MFAQTDADEAALEMRPTPLERARRAARLAQSLFFLGRSAIQRGLARIDPNEDPNADPLTFSSLVAFAIACGFSTWMLLRWKYQPMQDFGHHAALSAVVADYGRPGSLYTPLYAKFDPLAANSLMYQVAGRIGRLVGVTNALRGCMTFYVAGTPIALLYALRVFGRSPWAAVLATPLVYNMNFVAGFANMLFAAPLMIMAIVTFYRALERPTWRRVLGSAIVFAVLFLAHAHVFMWTGAMCFVMALTFMAVVPATQPTLKGGLRSFGKLALVSFGSVALALLCFARWYARAFGAGRGDGAIRTETSTWANHYGAYFRSTLRLFWSFDYSFQTYHGDKDVDLLVRLFLLAGVAIALSRLHRFAKPPVLELAFMATGISYFFLPDGIQGHDVIAQRQLPISLWFLPALVSPVPARVSRPARLLVVAGIIWVTWTTFSSWNQNLLAFEREEVAGLETVMRAAPPRKRLHYVKIDSDSKYFEWHPFWHVDKLYMSDSFGQIADTPGTLSTSPIRYRKGVDIHRIEGGSSDWYRDSNIWKYFDLVLVRKWNSTEAMVKEADKHGSRLAKSGDWELWSSREATPIDLRVPEDPPDAGAAPPAK